MRMHRCCTTSSGEDAKQWYRQKFRNLLAKKLDPISGGNDALYQFQAVILEDLAKLGYTAYYNFDYDDEKDGAESLVLFNASAIDKVIPVELSYADMQDLINKIDNGSIDKDNIQQLKLAITKDDCHSDLRQH